MTTLGLDDEMPEMITMTSRRVLGREIRIRLSHVGHLQMWMGVGGTFTRRVPFLWDLGRSEDESVWNSTREEASGVGMIMGSM